MQTFLVYILLNSSNTAKYNGAMTTFHCKENRYTQNYIPVFLKYYKICTGGSKSLFCLLLKLFQTGIIANNKICNLPLFLYRHLRAYPRSSVVSKRLRVNWRRWRRPSRKIFTSPTREESYSLNTTTYQETSAALSTARACKCGGRSSSGLSTR